MKLQMTIVFDIKSTTIMLKWSL